jgi:TonB-linked SusC/RagA family outer membrane protein
MIKINRVLQFPYFTKIGMIGFLIFTSFLSFAQQKIIVNGNVFTENNVPLPGVSVKVKGSSVGTTTDADGKFTIQGSKGATLVLSFVGYEDKQVLVNNKESVINIQMVSITSTLSDVVVVGYGTQKKVNLTGAVSSISSKQLEMRPLTSTAQGLQGLIPNLNITFTDGNPAAGGVDFNIRGYESINGGNPLILVDGVPMDIQLINPNDIQSLTVLKDAGASAIYGARAAFGVILVTTKTGVRNAGDRMSIQYTNETAISQPIMHLDPVGDSYTYAIWKNKASIRTDGTPLYDDRFVAAVKAYHDDPTTNPEWAVYNGSLEFYGYNNWKNILVRDFAPSEKHNLVLSGATKNNKYYISLGYLNKDGFMKVGNDNFKRVNILMKADFKVTDWLSLDEKVTFNLAKTDGVTGYVGDFNSAIIRPVPLVPLFFPKLPGYESLEGLPIYINTNVLGLNTPYPILDHGGHEKTSNSDIWFTSGITLHPIKNLLIRGEYSKNYTFYEDEAVSNKIEYANPVLGTSNPIIFDPAQSNSSIIDQFNKTDYNVLNIYSEYSLKKGPHYLKAMAGFNQEWQFLKSIGATAFGLLSDNLPDISLTSGTQHTTGGRSELALRGVFYRLNYIFSDRYLFEADGRYDGTSRFPKNDRFGFFPSFSVGWRISNEKFMKQIKKYFDNLKIRASYGTLGNQLISSYYPYIASMGVGLSNFIFGASGQSPMVTAPGLVSPSLTWETVTSKNLGLDIDLFRERLNGSFDIYSRETKGMLMNAIFPDVLGANAPKINGANLKTTGWELSLSWHDKITNNLNYDVTFSLSDNQAVITKYNNPTGSLTDYYVGEKLGEIWGYKTVGIFQDSTEITKSASQSALGSDWRPGDIHYADLNGDGKINTGKNTITDHGDLTVIGNTTARYSYGVNLNIHYKNWSLNTFFQGVGKKEFFPPISGNAEFWPFGANTSFDNWMITESWSPNNTNAYFYAPSRAAGQNQQTQTRYLQNDAYLRCKNLTLSYTFPQKWVKKVGLSEGRIYLTGQNLFEFSKVHKPFDPEMNVTNYITYPFQRIYSTGVILSL